MVQGQARWPEDELLTRRLFEMTLMMHGVSRSDIKQMSAVEVVEYAGIIKHMSGDKE